VYFKVDGAFYNWELDRIQVFPLESFLSPYASITTSHWLENNVIYEGYRFLIHDPIGFFNEVRNWAEINPAGTPVAVVEALPADVIVYGACGMEPIHYDVCRTVTPFVPYAHVVFENNFSIDMGTSIPSGTACNLNVYFPCDVAGDFPGGDNLIPKMNNKAPSDLDLQVFPNPTSDQLFVQFNESSKGSFQLELFNASGQKIYTTDRRANQNNQPIDLRRFPPGFYLLRVSDFSTGQMYSKKVLLQR
ncbi:MAG: T9SS type A sorting domain-containing protein, partial [Bacteroidota bacterium]